MSKQRNAFDVWIVASQTVYRAVPYNIVTDWVGQGRLLADDRLRLSGTEVWTRLGDTAAFATYLPRADETAIGDEAEALEKVELEMQYRHIDDEDEDVDMIPLIDISLVLLIFFMMTSTVAIVKNSIDLPESMKAFIISPDADEIWVGMDRVGTSIRPIFSVGVGSKAAAAEEANLTKEAALAAVERRLKERRDPSNIRISAHKRLSVDQVQDLMDELEKMRSYAGPNNQKLTHIQGIRAETVDKGGS
jgi:biopolymer transport protein ExbD